MIWLSSDYPKNLQDRSRDCNWLGRLVDVYGKIPWEICREYYPVNFGGMMLPEWGYPPILQDVFWDIYMINYEYSS